MLLGVLIAYVVPAALWGTHVISSHYTDRLKAKHLAQIETFKQEFNDFKTQSLSLKDRFSVFSPSKSVDEMRTVFSGMASSLAASSRASVMAFLYYVLIVCFELIFLPFLSAFILYKVLQAAIDEAFGVAMGRRRHREPPTADGTVETVSA